MNDCLHGYWLIAMAVLVFVEIWSSLRLDDIQQKLDASEHELKKAVELGTQRLVLIRDQDACMQNLRDDARHGMHRAQALEVLCRYLRHRVKVMQTANDAPTHNLKMFLARYGLPTGGTRFELMNSYIDHNTPAIGASAQRAGVFRPNQNVEVFEPETRRWVPGLCCKSDPIDGKFRLKAHGKQFTFMGNSSLHLRDTPIIQQPLANEVLVAYDCTLPVFGGTVSVLRWKTAPFAHRLEIPTRLVDETDMLSIRPSFNSVPAEQFGSVNLRHGFGSYSLRCKFCVEEAAALPSRANQATQTERQVQLSDALCPLKTACVCVCDQCVGIGAGEQENCAICFEVLDGARSSMSQVRTALDD
jgi:hypothetical protein